MDSITPEELRARFPHATQSTFRVNPGVNEIRPVEPEHAPGQALDGAAQGEAAGGAGFDCLFAEGVRITFAFYARKPKDASNHFIKPLEDALVTAGIIPDDNYAVVREICLRSCRINKGHQPLTIIKIEKLPWSS